MKILLKLLKYKFARKYSTFITFQYGVDNPQIASVCVTTRGKLNTLTDLSAVYWRIVKEYGTQISILWVQQYIDDVYDSMKECVTKATSGIYN